MSDANNFSYRIFYQTKYKISVRPCHHNFVLYVLFLWKFLVENEKFLPIIENTYDRRNKEHM